MQCIGKDKLLAAASWTRPDKVVEVEVLNLVFASNECGAENAAGCSIEALSGMLNKHSETRDTDWSECVRACVCVCNVMNGEFTTQLEETEGEVERK